MTNNYCGLDFGTSNSTIGIYSDTAFLVKVEGEDLNIPSAIFFDFEEHCVRFGRRAISEYIDGTEGRMMRALKSILGSSLMEDKTKIGRSLKSFHDILGLFIRHLKEKAEKSAGQSLEHVVIGRPVFFVDGDQRADQRAQDTLEKIAREQGFSHVEFQYEPVAAASDYESRIDSEKLALIVDIGGGTADFSVLRIMPDGNQRPDRSRDILGNVGIHIGGTDFDRLLSLHTVMPHLGYKSMMRDMFDEHNVPVPPGIYHHLATWHKILLASTQQNIRQVKDIRRTAFEPQLLDRLLRLLEHQLGHYLALCVENAKIALTNSQRASIDMSLIENGFSVDVSREQLNNILAEQIESLQKTIKTAISMAGIAHRAVDTVFLTGGSSEMPILRDMVFSLVPEADIVDGDKFGSVGRGLTIDAQRRFGSRV